MDKQKKKIISIIDKQAANVFTQTEFRALFHQIKDQLDLKKSLSFSAFCKYWEDSGELKSEKLKFPWRTFGRFVWKSPKSNLHVISSIDEKGYFSHFTAVTLHQLTLENPKNIYFNVEQRPRPPGQGLNQGSIDRAFKNNPRTTKQVAKYDGYEVHYLMGKNTANLGVIEQNGIKYTDIERTMIDIAVRPVYCGGIREVLNVYRNVCESDIEISINRLRSYLSTINYVYPYHQSIGFLLEKAGFKSPILELFEKDITEYQFYLDYKIRDAVFDEKWKVYIPNDLE